MGLRIWSIISLWGSLSIGILGGASVSLAEVRVLLLGEEPQYSLSGKLEILEDKAQQVSLNDVLKGGVSSSFLPQNDNRHLNFGVVNSSYWLRVRLQADHPQRRDWYLRIGNPHLDEVVLTLVRDGRVVKTYRMGDSQPFQERPFQHRLFIFPFETEAGEELEMLMQVRIDGRGFLPLDIISPAVLMRDSARMQMFFGVIFGMMLVAFLYALLGNLANSGEENIWLWCYLLSLIMFNLAQEKLDFAFLLSSWPVLSNHQASLWGNLMLAAACLFCVRYFQTEKNTPRLDKALKMQAGIQLLGMSLLFWNTQASLTFVCIFGGATWLLILATGIIYLRHCETRAKLFLVNWGGVISGAIIHILQLQGVIPHNVFTTNAFFVGAGIQACSLVLSLSYNLSQTKNTFRDALHQTVRRECHVSELYRSLEKFIPTEKLSMMGKKDLTDIELGDYTKRNMTVLFSDIRSFTSMSENMSPEDNFRFLISYLKRMEAAVRNHKGFIDKYTGDGVMALYPGSADNAVESAIAMQKSVREQNHIRKKYGHVPIQVGIGLNTGPLIMGFLGGSGYMESTVISDAVNTASRTEELTKVYGSKVIITDNTLKSLHKPDNFVLRELDKVEVKGKSKFVQIYEVLNAEEDILFNAKQETLSDFQKGRNLYEQERYSEAAACMRRCVESCSMDKAAGIWLGRCHQRMNQGAITS